MYLINRAPVSQVITIFGEQVLYIQRVHMARELWGMKPSQSFKLYNNYYYYRHACIW